jgi:transcriptional antiterminator NusG
MPIFIVRTTAGRERQVVDKLEVIGKKKQNINAILNPQGIRGYIFVEASSRDDVVTAVYGLGHAKGIIQTPVPIEKVEHFLTAAPLMISIKENDIVELISGPFKGEKAKVTRVAADKEEIVVALLDTTVPIPMKVSTDTVRLIQTEEREDVEREEELKKQTRELRKPVKEEDEFEEAF